MPQLGDGPVEEAYIVQMNAIAHTLDEIFNGKGTHNTKPNTGFVLLVFPFNDHEGRCNYISNTQREDIIVLFKEQIARFEGQPELSGSA